MKPAPLLAALILGVAWGPRAEAAQTVVSLTFDDGSADHALAGRMLDQRGLKGTFYVNSSQLGSSGWYMTRADVDALYAHGHEIGGHTLDHLALDTIVSTEVVHQVCDDRRNLIAWGYAPDSFAYPFGSHDAAVESAVRGCGYSNARSVGDYFCPTCPKAETLPPLDVFAIRAPGSIAASDALADIEALVVDVENAGGGWVPLVFHHICAGCGGYSVTEAVLAGFLDWLKARDSRGTVVRTVREAMATPPPPAPAPAILSLSPSPARAGGPAFTLTVTGSDFAADATARWNGAARATTFVSAAEVRAAIGAADIAGPGAASVSVANPDGQVSAMMSVGIVAPAPALVSLSSASVLVGSPGFTLRLTGANFLGVSTVLWNGQPRNAAFVDGGTLTTALLASELASARESAVAVSNPAPGGGTSAAAVFRVENPAPSLAVLQPSSATVGGPGFTLRLYGRGFIRDSAVYYNGRPRSTVFVSSAQLSAALMDNDLAPPSAGRVSVANPGPGGGNSSLTLLLIAPRAADPAYALRALYAFPNPARGAGTVAFRIQAGAADGVVIRVYDLAGRRVHSSSNFTSLGAFDDGNGGGAQLTFEHLWDVSGVATGLYTYVVTARKAGQADVGRSGKVGVVK